MISIIITRMIDCYHYMYILWLYILDIIPKIYIYVYFSMYIFWMYIFHIEIFRIIKKKIDIGIQKKILVNIHQLKKKKKKKNSMYIKKKNNV